MLILGFINHMTSHVQRSFNDNSHKLVLNQKVIRLVPKHKLLSTEIYRNSLSTWKGWMYAVFLYISSLHLWSHCLRTLRLQSFIIQISLDIHYILWFILFFYKNFSMEKCKNIQNLSLLNFNNYQLISQIPLRTLPCPLDNS